MPDHAGDCARPSRTATSEPHFDVLVIGCGFAGICMGIHLRRAGFSFAILERGCDIGGTWRDNTYPGCACDIPSHLYSFSFELNPGWSRLYPSQPEILDYLQRCVDKYGLRERIKLDCEVREAVFDASANIWRVRTGTGDCFSAAALVPATGLLSRPAVPSIAGIERFRGAAFHSAHWKCACDLAGKKVAIIGTGASAIQIVPKIAPRVARLAIFQRTPPWVLPKPDGPIGDWLRLVFRRVPVAMRLFRALLYLLQESSALGFIHPRLMRPVKKLALARMARRVSDPSLRQALEPKYAMGCKRILLSNDYYPAVARSNVQLITHAIAEIRDDAIVTDDGTEHEVDAIIFATGFRAADVLAPVRIVGRDGIELNAAWRGGAEAYRGITVSGFPNMFLLMGPNTLLAHNSIVFMIEAQVHYVLQCLKWLRRRPAGAIDLRPAVQARFNRDLRRRSDRSVWASGCKSYYLDDRGRNVILWPGSTVRYWLLMRRFSPNDYSLLRGASGV